MGQVGGARVGDPLPEPGVVARVGGQQGGEGADRGRPGRSSRGRRPSRPASVSCWPAVRRSGLVSRIRAARRGDRCGRSPSSAALVDVADEEVGAALVAEFPDLPQQLLDRDAGFFGPALAEVVAVGVDEGGPVLRDALQPLGLAGAVVALDRVQRQAQAAGAVQQARRSGHAGHGPAASAPGWSRPACPPAAGMPFAQQAECAATSFRTASPRPCHRCQRSLTCTARAAPGGRPRRRRPTRHGTRPRPRDGPAATSPATSAVRPGTTSTRRPVSASMSTVA